MDTAQRVAIAQMVRQVKGAGIVLTGPDGLLEAVTARIGAAAVDEELNEQLGGDTHDPVGRGSGNSRTGAFESSLVKKRQRRVSGIDAMV